MTAGQTRAALEKFYSALAGRDAGTMAAMYAPDAAFNDPVFRLRGPEIGRMWETLLGRARDFSVTWEIRRVEADRGEVAWTARYLFAAKRPVVNVIESDVRFKGGQIVEQNDRFDFRRWSAQALGAPGRLLGRFEWFRRSVARRARRALGLPGD